MCELEVRGPRVEHDGDSVKAPAGEVQAGGSAQILGVTPTVRDSPDLYLYCCAMNASWYTSDAKMTYQVYISVLLNLYIVYDMIWYVYI